MKPRPRTSPDDWARANRIYKPSADRPGPREPSLTPFLVPFAQAFDIAAQIATYGHRYDAVVMACGSQMGKTDTVLDIVGWTMDQRPAPIMYVGPNKEFLHQEIEPRLMDMLLGTSALRDRLAMGKRMTKWRKVIGGVQLRLAWAGSAAAVAGMAAKYALIDELDRMKSSIQNEGDPFSLVEARGFSFRDRLRAAISTPLKGNVEIERDEASGLELWKQMQAEDVESPIWRLWQSGTRHHFCWPCPHCEDYFVPRFRQLRWPEGAQPIEARRSAFVECPTCGGVIEEHHKKDLNARGVYVAPGQTVAPDGTVTGPLPDTVTLSFWVSGLCSPFVTFGERAASYVTAKLSGEQDKLQGVINTGFGECYLPGGGDVPEWQEVAQLKRGYKRGQVPSGVRVLTLSVDVQKRRLVYVIRGWGAAGSSWLVDHGELFGPTTEGEVWSQLADLIHRPIDGFTIKRGFVDSGFRPGKPEFVPVNKVYAFCRRFPRLIYPTKGLASQDRPLVVRAHDVTQRGQVKKYGLDLVTLDTDHCKRWVHERIRWEAERPGAWLLPDDVSDDYCKQIVSEARIVKPNGQPQWVPRSRENHYLDCEAMQAGLAHMLNVHLMRAAEDETARPVRSRPASRRPVASAAPPHAKPPPDTTASPAPAAPKPSREARTATREARRKRIAELAQRYAR